jgi:hypothetical protein
MKFSLPALHMHLQQTPMIFTFLEMFQKFKRTQSIQAGFEETNGELTVAGWSKKNFKVSLRWLGL